MAKINVLPKEVYQLIAAGEVVERPSSIVKEMLENSIDAGAKSVTVEIKNGGSSYIRITDDGCGIEKADVPKVFISHATSKIEFKHDLDAISTLGFRGEAMSSVCAVAKVELITKSKSEQVGSRYVIHGGEEVSFDDAGCPDGTTIVVRDIFYNVPARMKFLKKDVTEGNSVAGIVDRVALSHPEISFRFIRDGKQVLFTNGNGSLSDAVYCVFGAEFHKTLIPVEYNYSSMRITGLVSNPLFPRKSRSMQYFFINSRMVKSKTMMAALEQAYKNNIMVGKFPACILNLELNTSLVDVNVHPAKTEVRFTNEKPIFEIVYYAVKSAVESNRDVKHAVLNSTKTYTKEDFAVKKEQPKQFRFNVLNRENNESADAVASSFKVNFSNESSANNEKEEAKVQQKILPKSKIADVSVECDDTENENNNALYSNFKFKENKGNFEYIKEDEKTTIANENDLNTEKEKISFSSENVSKTDKSETPSLTVDDEPPEIKVIGEAFKTYIIAEVGGELLFIDKHAAHERINYEKLKANDGVYPQVLLTPVTVKLSKEEYTAIIDNIDALEKTGFAVEDFGNYTVIVRECPSLVANEDIADLIVETASKLLDKKTDILPDKIDWIYHSTACRSAVKAGNFTSRFEMEKFVKNLLAMPNIRFCPHGRPVFIKFTKYEIEKLFGRIQ